MQGAGSKAWLHVQPALWKPIPNPRPDPEPVRSNVAKAADGWQKLSVEFTTPPDHGRSPLMSFHAQPAGADGGVSLDDVLFTPLQ